MRPPASAAPGRFHDLMDALMAEAERLGDFTERSARELEPAHRPVKPGSGDVSCLLGIDEARFSCLGLVQQVGIQRHASSVSRRKTATLNRPAAVPAHQSAKASLERGATSRQRQVGARASARVRPPGPGYLIDDADDAEVLQHAPGGGRDLDSSGTGRADAAGGHDSGERDSGRLAWYGDSACGTGDLRGAIGDAGHDAVIKPKPLQAPVPGGFTVDPSPRTSRRAR